MRTRVRRLFCGRFRLGLVCLVMIIVVSLNGHAVFFWTRSDGGNLIKQDPMTPGCCNSVEIQISAPANVSGLETKETLPQAPLQLDQVSVIGIRRHKKGFLTIGVPSIKRVNGPSYLLQTLESLIERVTQAEKPNVTVVVFLADQEEEYNNATAREVVAKHAKEIKSGFLQVIQVPESYYPQLIGLKQNFGDAPDRVQWRSKQVIDFALMFEYSQNISEYYIQIEDDVECSQGFVSAIRSYILERSQPGVDLVNWAMLEFSELGFIGKLFRSSDLDRLSRYMRMFYAEQPVDWLMSYFRLSMGQRQTYLRIPTLFQHFGVKSSFDLTKDNLLKDRYFEPQGDKLEGVIYPSAIVLSTMPHSDKFVPELAYKPGLDFFWATKVQRFDTIHVVFEVEQHNLTRIRVDTGNSNSPRDILESGIVSLASSVSRVDDESGKAECNNLKKVASFVNGTAVVEKVPSPVKCIEIRVEANQSHWVVFRRILVYQQPVH